MAATAATLQGYNFKVVLLGEGCVGKTSCVLRYVEDKFNDKHITTLQVEHLLHYPNRRYMSNSKLPTLAFIAHLSHTCVTLGITFIDTCCNSPTAIANSSFDGSIIPYIEIAIAIA